MKLLLCLGGGSYLEGADGLFKPYRVPKVLYYKEYFQIPLPDKGKWRRFYFEMVFRWNILPKYLAD
jgi:hypothetical protein